MDAELPSQLALLAAAIALLLLSMELLLKATAPWHLLALAPSLWLFASPKVGVFYNVFVFNRSLLDIGVPASR